MRFTFFLALLMVSFVTSDVYFADAESNSFTDKVIPAFYTQLIDPNNNVRYLRGKHKINNEERAGINYAAASNLLSSTSTTSTISAHSEPLSKKAKAILTLLGIVMTGGIIYGGVKVAKGVGNEQ
ncbi:putative RxLR effector [Phytophthora palmivora]|uniref:RxLR effector n=1 Tax=Phytophthora palmivora TaxID=4796 RepID=A0A2P4X1M2_9STRA|nr:putative RxLR effector [Phytophthora palmivora]